MAKNLASRCFVVKEVTRGLIVEQQLNQFSTLSVNYPVKVNGNVNDNRQDYNDCGCVYGIDIDINIIIIMMMIKNNNDKDEDSDNDNDNDTANENEIVMIIDS